MTQYYKNFKELYDFKNGKTREPKRYEEPKPAKKPAKKSAEKEAK